MPRLARRANDGLSGLCRRPSVISRRQRGPHHQAIVAPALLEISTAIAAEIAARNQYYGAGYHRVACEMARLSYS